MSANVANRWYDMFQRLVSRCVVETKEKTVHVEGSWITQKVVTFNDLDGYASFLTELQATYTYACTEIESNIEKFSRKGDYVFYLERKLRTMQELAEDNFTTVNGSRLNLKFEVNTTAGKSDFPETHFQAEFYQQHFDSQYKYIMRMAGFLKAY